MSTNAFGKITGKASEALIDVDASVQMMKR